MSSPLNIDVCPISFISYLTNPIVYAVVYSYDIDVKPKCTENGLAPYRLVARVYLVNYPYSGTIIVYVDGNKYGEFKISDGLFDQVLLLTPGTHTISFSTPDGNILEVTNVTATCI